MLYKYFAICRSYSGVEFLKKLLTSDCKLVRLLEIQDVQVREVRYGPNSISSPDTQVTFWSMGASDDQLFGDLVEDIAMQCYAKSWYSGYLRPSEGISHYIYYYGGTKYAVTIHKDHGEYCQECGTVTDDSLKSVRGIICGCCNAIVPTVNERERQHQEDEQDEQDESDRMEAELDRVEAAASLMEAEIYEQGTDYGRGR